jgi:hypothetical protein
MSDTPKSKTKQRSLIWRVCRWSVLAVGAVTLFQSGYFLIMQLAFNITIGLPSLAEKIAFALVNLTAVVFLAWLLYRPFCRGVGRLARRPDGQPTLLKRALGQLIKRRMIPRYLFCVACLATLLGVFYAVEDWRGKRAWEKCRRELEAKGAVLDWNAFIPALVPDEQNIFKAPKIAEWFVKESWNAAARGGLSRTGNTNAPFSRTPFWNTKRPPTLLAEVNVVLRDGPLPTEETDLLLRLGDPADREAAAKLIRERVGACTEDGWMGLIIGRSLDQIHPLHLVLQAETMPTPNALTEFLASSGAAMNQAGATPGQKYLEARRFGSQGFHVSLTPSEYGAADCLAKSEPAVPDLELVRQADARPYARMDGDYQRPFESPLPNFLTLRTVSQMLAQRAKCYLLLGQPAAAWHELALVRDMCRMIEAKPAGNSPTLVATMIDVAITGLYTSIIQDGLRLHAWGAPELAAIQSQLMDVNLLPLFRDSFSAQRAALCRAFETALPVMLSLIPFRNSADPHLFWARLREEFPLVICAPQGWIYQNMCVIARQDQMVLGAIDIANDQLLPGKFEEIGSEIATYSKRHSMYTLLALLTLPHYTKASQVLARNQTLVNEAFIACGLERYRLAREEYPESLDALVPQFAAKLPHDIVGGAPLKYHRTADGRFVLYSVGWNEKDDGGVVSKSVEEGDWGWP